MSYEKSNKIKPFGAMEFKAKEGYLIKGIILESKNEWYKRLWFLVSNPFTYLFKGIIRY